MSALTIANCFNHVAYFTADTAATYRFYTEVLGLKLVAAMRGDRDPETGAARPHLHTMFAMRSGQTITFFDIEGAESPKLDGLPIWARHLAMSVDSHDELMAWRQRLIDHAVEVTPVIDHASTWYSIYFPDPNGVLLELTYQARELDQDDAAAAARALDEWTRAHRQKMLAP